MLLSLQVNAYNIFNILQLQPITNGNANPGANIQSATFGEAQGADAGRVIEFVARIQFQAKSGNGALTYAREDMLPTDVTGEWCGSLCREVCRG